MLRCSGFSRPCVYVAAIAMSTSTCIRYLERVFSLGPTSANDKSATSRLETVEMVNVGCKITLQFAGRVSKSHVYRKRGSLCSRRSKKHGWWLVVLVVSISPVSARPFSSSRGKISRGNGGAKEQVQQGRTSREDWEIQKLSVAKTVVLELEAYREPHVE
jgi:hypothetical protein